MEKKYDIFISYRRDGGLTTAVLLKSELAHLGYKVFLDFDDLPAGQVFQKAIHEAIKFSYMFLFIYSSGCLDRCGSKNDVLRREIECAIENSVKIVPLNVNMATAYYNFPPKEAHLPKKIIDALGSHNFLDFFTGQYKQDSLVHLSEFIADDLSDKVPDSEKKQCSLALLSDIDCEFRIGEKVLTALKSNTLKHIQIAYGTYNSVCFKPLDGYHNPTPEKKLIIAYPTKELHAHLEDFELMKSYEVEGSKLNLDGMTAEQITEKGWDYMFNGEPMYAIECWKIASQSGNAAAQYSLGYQYSKGEYVPRNTEKAFELLLQGAMNGDSRAQFMLGDAYYYGEGTRCDFYQAVDWYRRSSAQDNAKALYSLACCYHKGQGVEKNEKVAFENFLKSARLGYHNAQLQVAYSYKLGLGTKADLSESRKWFEKAAAQGSETAKIYVERLNKM